MKLYGILEERLKRLCSDLIGIGTDIAFGHLDSKVSRIITTEERHIIDLIIGLVLNANEIFQKKTGNMREISRFKGNIAEILTHPRKLFYVSLMDFGSGQQEDTMKPQDT